VIECNEWKIEKRHEFTNMGKLKTTRIMMATVRHVDSSSGQKISGRLIFIEQRVQ